MRTLITLGMALFLAAVSGFAAEARDEYIHRLGGFESYVRDGEDETTSDRFFTRASFKAPQRPYRMDTTNMGHFRDGVLRWFDRSGNQTETHRWTDLVPLARRHESPWGPDRPVRGTEFVNEHEGYGTLQEMFEGSIINRLLNAPKDAGHAYLELYFGGGTYVQSDGDAGTTELALFVHGGDSAVYVQAVRADRTLSNILPLNLRDFDGSPVSSDWDPVTRQDIPRYGRMAGYRLETMAGRADAVYGVGIDLMAFGNIEPSDRIIGYHIWYLNNDFCNFPNLMAFVLSGPTPVPEASTLAALATLVSAGGLAFRRRRR